ILTAKCVACHACYDAPCQLNLGSGEGVLRGASKLPVYDGTRVRAQATSRLYFDAHDEAAGLSRGVHPLFDPQADQASLLVRMLVLGRANPPAANARLRDGLDISIRRQNQGPLPDEFEAYARQAEHAGMPFAVAGLSDAEYA